AFAHVLLFLSLGAMAMSMATVLNIFIDRWFPIPTDMTTTVADNTETLRGYMAALIVSLPIFSFLLIHVTKRILHYPILKKLHMLKTLLYLTLIITFLISIYPLIFTLYTFLSGSMTLNSFFHFLVTAGIAGTIFTYCLLQVKDDVKLHA